MIKEFIHYLFPPLRTVEKLPLLPRGYVVKARPIPDEYKKQVEIILMYGGARSSADAIRLIKRYPKLSPMQIAEEQARKRRREPRLKRAWRRFKNLF